VAISNETRNRVKRLGEPVALFLGRLGLTPDALTLIGFAISVGGAALLAAQAWLLGGLVVFAGALFDMLDGTLARATGRASKLGAFMDSVFDRWGEGIVYVGIAWGTAVAEAPLGAVLAAAAMASAFMVSYTRAKSEGLGFSAGTGMAAVGLAPREVRIVILAAGLVAAGALGAFTPVQCIKAPCPPMVGDGGLVLYGALGLIAVLATITTIQRILHTRAQARAASPGPTTTPPEAPSAGS
jgi:CDP-diacylglycerol---glycerol-3-phosphate 3-phosphatidyltransferase